ncbi:MarR family winged helix-turn-helix transcriptional regulator [Streptomyces sp. NPDC057690]|uniref:MarR family winged helix-turn-helix transcriptional regulator n=1 Tax=Streptomyces sp. NPDC057690 TaxID=3346214 RepID=UPI0036996347
MPAFLLVNQLIYRGTARPSDLANSLSTDRSNVTKIVRRLEAAGLTMRVAAKNDKRSVVVMLTEQGRSVAQRALDSARELFGGLNQRWQPEELQQLEHLLFRFARDLDDLTEAGITQEAGSAWRA